MTQPAVSNPLALRSLQAILNRIQDAPAEPLAGDRVSTWCRTEGLPVEPDTPREVAQGLVVSRLVQQTAQNLGGLELH